MGLNPYDNHIEELEAAQIFADESFHPQVYHRGGMDTEEGFSRYVYPPFALPVFSLLAHFDYDTARTLWTAFYLLLYIAVILVTAYH
jgi:hypothetical protein